MESTRAALRRRTDAHVELPRFDYVLTARRACVARVATVSRPRCGGSRRRRGTHAAVSPRELLAGEGAQLVERRVGVGPRHDDGDDAFAPFVVGHPDHAHVFDVGMAQQHAFDLGRADVHAARDHEVLQPVDDDEPAAVVVRADVAGVEPAVAVEHLGGALGVEAIAAHHHRAPHQDLVVGAEPHVGARDRDAVEREAAPRFREPVGVDDVGTRGSRPALATWAGTARRPRSRPGSCGAARRRRADDGSWSERAKRSSCLPRRGARATRSMSKPSCTTTGTPVTYPRASAPEARDVVQRQAREPAVVAGRAPTPSE